jgi:hypothetical protein
MKYQNQAGAEKLRLMSLRKTEANRLQQAPNQETAKEQAHDISETLRRQLVAIREDWWIRATWQTRSVRPAPTRLHADQASRQIGEPGFDLATRPLLPQHDGTALVLANEVK